jgi:predicted nucleotidyltransferase
MNAQEIQKYLRLLGAELEQRGVTGEIVLVGGAVMLLVIGNRQTTKDIDAYFVTNAQQIRAAALVVAQRERVSPNWLNDAVKGFFYSQPPTSLWLDVPGLRIYTADPAYILAMKAAAGRPEDIGDIQALAAHLQLTSAQGILSVVTRYIPSSQLTPRTEYLIQTLFP